LRTRLVLVAMVLLVAICAAIGLFSYASMDSFLTRQLDDQLTGAERVRRRHRRQVRQAFLRHRLKRRVVRQVTGHALGTAHRMIAFLGGIGISRS